MTKKPQKRRKENNVILIICCGETEERYFKEFNLDLAKIKIRTITRAKCPTQIVEYARRVAVNEQYRHIWCVFDKDEYEDFDTAIQLAQKAGIGVAYSNQVIEYGLYYIMYGLTKK